MELFHGRQDHLKFSPIGKSPIRHIYLFDVTVVTVINVQKNGKICLQSFGVLQSYFTAEIGFYIWPKLKNRISSTCVRIFTSFILILLCSSYAKNRISPSWKIFLIAIFQLYHGENKLFYQ